MVYRVSVLLRPYEQVSSGLPGDMEEFRQLLETESTYKEVVEVRHLVIVIPKFPLMILLCLLALQRMIA